MCKYCKSPNKTIVKHRCGVAAFVGTGLLFLRLYDKKNNCTIVNFANINYCPICGHNFKKGG